MSALDWSLVVGFLVLGVFFIGTSNQRAADYRRAGRKGPPTRPAFFIALGVLWLLLAAVQFIDA